MTDSVTPAAADLLEQVLAPRPPAFALMHRPERTGGAVLEVLVGEFCEADALADVPLPESGRAGHDVLVFVPYRQLAERGFACNDDGEPLLAMTVAAQASLPCGEALAKLPDLPTRLTGEHFDVSDDEYAGLVRTVLSEEIGRGEGGNFVLKRSYVAEITDYTPQHALSLFRRLMQQETGAYWTFIVHTGDRTFVGATPERHISVHGGTAVMNPISGTYRYPPSGPALPDLLEFLDDRKETEELYMVLDEELKMMAGVCDGGGRVVGPYLKEMARLAHTEYLIEGHTALDPREILRQTMFAPTVTGSPLENACRTISRYEPVGRGYYSGVVALIGRDESGGRTLDSSILIRTADIDRAGRIRIGVGATLVRHSDPVSEVAETRAKAAGLLAALQTERPARLGEHPQVRAALARRNTGIAGFWLTPAGERGGRRPPAAGRRVLVVDAEDAFTGMLGHQLRSLGLEVTVRRFDERYTAEGYDLVVMGPGPGDPLDDRHPKTAHLRSALGRLLAERRPFIAVCLSHQVLSARLGLEVIRKEMPNQGLQLDIDLFGVRERVGFYNTFAARCADDKIDCPGVGMVEVSRDPVTGEVYALRGPRFASVQFHAESVLTVDGVRIIADRVGEALGRPLSDRTS
ncbi:phenazine-specific anthranilate synthase component I [Streptomyces sp. HNM0575]|uniref:anthranilate synthase family protein n=1 Tax=Streptomyces sp. HNM0575 TaxID=2716338 RepID=UPI00145EE9FC|nr:anthranilate synthase family protein [Streptomyces sp. HNM0575]NLU73972.1 phenazine-specific anthranilate synthase component I [Streptomyces sp. HNM0575]